MNSDWLLQYLSAASVPGLFGLWPDGITRSHKRVVNLWNSWRSCFLKDRRGGGRGGAVAYWQAHSLSHNKAILSYQTRALILLTRSAFKASLKILSFLAGTLMASIAKKLINLQVSVLTMLRGKHVVCFFFQEQSLRDHKGWNISQVSFFLTHPCESVAQFEKSFFFLIVSHDSSKVGNRFNTHQCSLKESSYLSISGPPKNEDILIWGDKIFSNLRLYWLSF